MQNDIKPEYLYNLMCSVHRVYYGSSDHWKELHEIAKKLYNTPETKEPESILIGGWRLDEEFHGGYESSSGKREVLGQGVLLYKGTFAKKTEKNYPQRTTSSITIEAWAQKTEERVIFLALRTIEEVGYVGIDNHYGTDTTWEVIGLRIVNL